MKIGFRKPSIKKSIKAGTTAKSNVKLKRRSILFKEEKENVKSNVI